jgi:hypothetical protein
MKKYFNRILLLLAIGIVAVPGLVLKDVVEGQVVSGPVSYTTSTTNKESLDIEGEWKEYITSAGDYKPYYSLNTINEIDSYYVNKNSKARMEFSKYHKIPKSLKISILNELSLLKNDKFKGNVYLVTSFRTDNIFATLNISILDDEKFSQERFKQVVKTFTIEAKQIDKTTWTVGIECSNEYINIIEEAPNSYIEDVGKELILNRCTI